MRPRPPVGRVLQSACSGLYFHCPVGRAPTTAAPGPRNMTTLAVNQLQLAPLGAGDLIDRAIRLYRRNFVSLIRASAPPVVVSTIGAVAWTAGVRAISLADSGASLTAYFLLAAFGLIFLLVGNLMHLIVMGGASRNLVMHLLWDEPVSTRAIYRSVRARFWGLLWATLIVGILVGICAGFAIIAWYVVILITVLAGVFVGAQVASVWLSAIVGLVTFVAATIGALYLFFLIAGRLAYVPQVMLVEGKGVFAAIGRSAELSRGNVRRLMAMFVFTTFATYSALMLLLIPLGWFGYLNGVDPFSLSESDWPMWFGIGYQVVTELSKILLAPVWMLGLSLLYVDERVRHEGYDVELQAARVFGEMPLLPLGTLTPLTPAIAATVGAAMASGADAHDADQGGTRSSFGGSSVLGLDR